MSILIAYDGSSDAKAAVEFAAKHFKDAPTVVVSVWEPLLVQLRHYPAAAPALLADDPSPEAQALAEKYAQEGADLARAAGLSEVSHRAVADTESIWKTIVEVADELGSDVIVIGSRGLKGIPSLLLGSVSNHVLHHSKRPTLIVKGD
ncbi:universal stress protein [Nonomuraea soli]|uniref:universal stress protein n=1 Tax=Nonomuraea soli TaxID=1032476 RepID=UPI0015EC7021|nr:universal stress protein [Nonomuraea soli]